MNWNLKCRRVQKLLALDAGHDLESTERMETERHLAVCPGCREHGAKLQAGQRVLELVRSSPTLPAGELPSVWPAVCRHIRSLQEQPAAPQWHGWLPVGALAAACLLVVVVTTQGPGPIGPDVAQQPLLPLVVQQVDSSASQSAPPTNWRDSSDMRRLYPEDQRPTGPRVRMLLDGTNLRDL